MQFKRYLLKATHPIGRGPFVALFIVSAYAQQQPGAVILDPSTANIQQIVNSAPEHSTFIFKAGVYKGLSLTPKNGDVFIGLPGTILDGSEVVTFKAVNPRLWEAKPANEAAEVVSTSAPCDKSLKNADGSHYTIGCTHSRSLYWDNQPLWRVATPGEVAPQKWYFDDTSKTIYVGENPTGHTVELGQAPNAFRGTGADIRIEGFRIEKYAGSEQASAIQCLGGNWKIRNNVVRWNHADGIGFSHCDGIEISGNVASFNGNLGLTGTGTNNATVEGNEMTGNNYARFAEGWEAGGGKWTAVQNMTIRNNRVSDNLGFGLWIDIDASGVNLEGNIVTNNDSGGILYEISRQGTIQNNIVALNGNGAGCRTPWLFCGQITVSTSSSVKVLENTIVVGQRGNGITVLDQERGAGEFCWRVARDNTVSDNVVTYLSRQGVSGAGSDRDKVFQNNNIFDGNTYFAGDGTEADMRFVWGEQIIDWAGLQQRGAEKHGRIGRTSQNQPGAPAGK